MSQEFIEKGFIIIKNGIDKTILDEARKILFDETAKICEIEEPYSAELFLKLVYKALEKYEQYELLEIYSSALDYFGIKKKILLSENILPILIDLLGPDLSYFRDSVVTINKKDEKNDFYIKDWHQEIWSGAGVHEVWLWLPLIIESGIGGMEFISSSHTWGLIPNQNRKPTWIPEDAKVIRPNIEEGDIVLFHPLTLHKTVPNTSDRMRIASVLGVRNFYHNYSNYEHHRAWSPFHLSPMAKIERVLGNKYLSPFRTYGSERKIFNK